MIEQMMPQEVRKWIDWEQTRSEQGPWPRKTVLSLWFIHDTALIMMLEIMNMIRDEMETAKLCVNGERVRTN